MRILIESNQGRLLVWRKGGHWQGSRIVENEGIGVTTVDVIINRDYEED